jgi:hypothetical protein
MAKDIRVNAQLQQNTIRANASVTGTMGASATLGQTVIIGGTTNYERLRNLPSIEGVTLIGNMTFPQLNMSKLTNSEIEALLQ